MSNYKWNNALFVDPPVKHQKKVVDQIRQFFKEEVDNATDKWKFISKSFPYGNKTVTASGWVKKGLT